MAKRNHILAPMKNQRGQISIFFSVSLIVLISIVAFVINIGLFVKAKINLQNATDAAAFSGAAVQARQLTKIGYLNWEMRNIYKEWLYKYYVIGNLNIQDVENPAGTGTMSFRLQDDVNPLTTQKVSDPYNIPAVCIHLAGSKTNICKRYSVPGLPEFGSSNLPGAEEASRAFLDALIATKVTDCVDRTRLNMLVATTWTYNILGNGELDNYLLGNGPAILADRQGAWPRAVELAIRIRNLEHIMNRPAETKRICNQGTTRGGVINCETSITEIMQERKMGNERIVKAFYSGYRNLGNNLDDEMKESFTLTEIPPKPMDFTRPADASYLLVPEDRQASYSKQWVDLKLMMANYAIFYAAMIPRADTETSGACDITKVAIPVPGYPLGFYKNPDLVTYYAVRGEAEFTGLFNPFRDGVVKLTAYSAAKPFGGRIGPMLFVQKPNTDYFLGRKGNSDKYRSQPYMASFDFVGTPKRYGGVLAKGEFEPGVPLPINFPVNPPGDFWLSSENSPIGGLLADAGGVQFGLPNMPFDFTAGFQATYTSGANTIHRIESKDKNSDLPIGLFNKEQFALFRGNISTGEITPQQLDQEIARVRAPTGYEAANYMIPTPQDYNASLGLDSFGFIGVQGEALDNGVTRYEADIYAPLYKEGTDQTDLLFENKNQVVDAIKAFMRQQETGIDKYRYALNKAAQAIFLQGKRTAGGAEGSAPGYEKAARGVSNIDFTKPEPEKEIPQDCSSIAGQFLWFFYGNVGVNPVVETTGCPVSLGDLISDYFSQSDPSIFRPVHYRMSYSWPTAFNGEPGKKMLSAYVPGPFSGVSEAGLFTNPIAGSGMTPELMRRNFYSTKFVTLDSLRESGGYNENNSRFVIYSEGEVNVPTEDRKQHTFKNSLNPNAVGADISSIKY